MLYGNINEVGDKFLHPAFQQAVKYLKETDFTNMEPGKIELQGKEIIAMITNVKTDLPENKKAEAHKKYVDVQFSINGNEKIGVAKNDGSADVTEDLLDVKDAIFFKNVKNEYFITMEKGSYLILFPEDIHRPACALENPLDIKKVIIKISVDLLK